MVPKEKYHRRKTFWQLFFPIFSNIILSWNLNALFMFKIFSGSQFRHALMQHPLQDAIEKNYICFPTKNTGDLKKFREKRSQKFFLLPYDVPLSEPFKLCSISRIIKNKRDIYMFSLCWGILYKMHDGNMRRSIAGRYFSRTDVVRSSDEANDDKLCDTHFQECLV